MSAGLSMAAMYEGKDINSSIRGRGSGGNPANRFESLRYEWDSEWDNPADSGEPQTPAPRTQFFRDLSRSALSHNDSPDVGFDSSVNPYRGCEHGCIYCYARPTHEYLGLSAGLDFETKIFVKEDAPGLLRRELSSSRWRPQVIAMSGVCDPYQPIERKLQLTRRCLEVLLEFRNPVTIITKNHMVTRDIDILAGLARFTAASVCISVTSLDEALAGVMEPRTSRPHRRLEAIRMLSEAGVPTGVLVAPVIPGLTDHELPSIIRAAADAGASFAGFVPLRLPYAVNGLFEDWLGQHFPLRKEKVLNRIRSMREGRLNDSTFHVRMQGRGIFAGVIRQQFDVACRRAAVSEHGPELSAGSFRRPSGAQLELFGEHPV